MGALLALGVLAPPSAPAAERRAVLAWVERAELAELARVPGAAAGLVGATQGRYSATQTLLDVSQGARTSPRAYEPEAVPALRARPGRIVGWDAAVRRAGAAPADLVPGLLAGSLPAGAVAFAGAPRLEAVAAARRDGTFARDAARARLVVTVLPDVEALRALVDSVAPATLVVAVRAPPRAAREAQLLPAAVVGLGGAGRALRSATTRRDGLVTAIDLGPTLLRWLGRDVPGDMTGEPITPSGSALEPGGLADLAARLRVVPGRRLPLLAAGLAAWGVLLGALTALGGREGARRGVRIGALAVLWLLPVLLVTGALAPSRAAEGAGAVLGALALGALCDALVPWPRAPLVPGAVGVVAYAVDLAAGSDLVVRSLFGPNPLFGARFYGVGNELEATLPVLALAATAAALTPRGRSRGAALAFAAVGLALALVLGAGRLGADVGGVITVGAGFAVACALAAPGRVTRRRVAAVLAAPVAGLALLALVDVVTGGDAHLTRSVLRADDADALGDVVLRRGELALAALARPAMLVLTPLALLAIALGVRHRERLLAGVPGAPLWAAALAGAAAGGVAGALTNDSGPLLLVFATVVAAWTAAYVRARPHPDRSRL